MLYSDRWLVDIFIIHEGNEENKMYFCPNYRIHFMIVRLYFSTREDEIICEKGPLLSNDFIYFCTIKVFLSMKNVWFMLLICVVIFVLPAGSASALSVTVAPDSLVQTARTDTTLPKEGKDDCLHVLINYLATDSLLTDSLQLYSYCAAKLDTTKEITMETAKSYYKDAKQKADSVIRMAIKLIQTDKYPEVIRLLEENLFCFYAYPGSSLVMERDLHYTLARVYATYYTKEKAMLRLDALQLYTQKHFELLQQLTGIKNIFLPEYIYQLSVFYYNNGDPQRSINTLKELLKLISPDNGNPEYLYMTTLTRLGALYEEIGDLKEAAKCKLEFDLMVKLIKKKK